MFLWESVAYAMAPTQGGADGGNPITAFVPLILMFAIFYFLLIRPQQKRQKEHKQMLADLTRGDYVLTGGGIYGRIVEVDGDVFSVDVGNEVVLKVNRGYVSAVTDSPEKEAKKKADKKADKKAEK